MSNVVNSQLTEMTNSSSTLSATPSTQGSPSPLGHHRRRSSQQRSIASRNPSNRNSGVRRRRGNVPTVPTATAKLLTSTKALLQSLTFWANKRATVAEVSENFVHVGDNFKALRKSYMAAGLASNDMPDIPRKLRRVLEESLVLEPSQDSLDVFLPQVGQIIADLMKVLKLKRLELEQMPESRRMSEPQDSPSRPSSSASSAATSGPSIHVSAPTPHASAQIEQPTPFPGSAPETAAPGPAAGLAHEPSKSAPNAFSDSASDTGSISHDGQPLARSSDYTSKPTNDLLARLESNNSLKRRASTRYSQFQTSTIMAMNRSTYSPPPPSALSSVNGREAQVKARQMSSEALSGGKTLGTGSTLRKKLSAASLNDEASVASVPIPEESAISLASPLQAKVSKNIKEAEADKRLSRSLMGADSKDSDLTSVTPSKLRASRRAGDRIYLKHKNVVKKVDLRLPTTVANVKVLFTQKFGYSPTGDYPPIYIQDGPEEVAYEMEDLEDIQPGCILSLQQADMATVICDHLDSKFEAMRSDLTHIQEMTEKQTKKVVEASTAASAASAVSAATKAAAAVAEKKQQQQQKTVNSAPQSPVDSATVLAMKKEITDLKFELIKARQQQATTKNTLTTNVNELLEFIQKLQSVGLSPTGIINNPYMDHCKTKVSGECESLVGRIDNLQDIIEVLKVDMTKRRSRPSETQVKHILSELSATKSSLDSLTKYMVKERKNWNNRWQTELTAIVDEQEFFKEQETIVRLLGEDLGSADETFDLIQKCCVELSKNSQARRGPYLPLVDPSVSMNDVKNQVLMQVESLQPDHDQRVEAIAKAEKVRDMERAMLNKTEFEQELGDFVGSSKLKSSGGIDEVERRRKMKDEENLKSSFGVV